MNIQEIIDEIKRLQVSSQTLQPRDVLEQLLNLAEAVRELEKNLSGYNATDDVLNNPPSN
jgi:hypothetical protein